MLGIQAIKGTPEGFDYLIMGDVFMRPYPTYFNYDTKQVTFYTENPAESII